MTAHKDAVAILANRDYTDSSPEIDALLQDPKFSKLLEKRQIIKHARTYASILRTLANIEDEHNAYSRNGRSQSMQETVAKLRNTAQKLEGIVAFRNDDVGKAVTRLNKNTLTSVVRAFEPSLPL